MPGYGGGKAVATYLSSEAFCFLLDIDSEAGDRVSFQLMPEVISESKSANYAEIPIVGRSLPQLGYANSSSRVTNLSLQFVALQREGKYTAEWVEQQVRWLEAKVYPRYIDDWTFPPPRLLLVVGEAMGMQCVMTSCSTSWMGPWDATTGRQARPFRAQVDIGLQELGKNDNEHGHPFGHDAAVSGKNQIREPGSSDASPYVSIPLVVSRG
jgi:hypothetical protein